MDEFELIQRYFERANSSAGVIVGIGDDGAVLSPTPNKELVTVIDTLVEEVHFPGNTNAGDVGYRAVAVNLSDIAAMGATPRWMTLALSMPASDSSWLAAFSGGLFDAASEYGVALVGGDTTFARQTVVTVALSGEIERGRAILRSGAKPGDTIFVTGTIGDAAAALETSGDQEVDEFILQRYLRPSARVQYGQALVGSASAAIDISDGLLADLGKLLTASHVGGEIDLGCLPISAPVQSRYSESQQRGLALSGGDDYELCFTAAPNTLPDSDGLQVTAIGVVTQTPGLTAKLGGENVPYADPGYRHFQ